MNNILVVDDNKTSLMSAKTALGDMYKVTCVTMGSQALKFLEMGQCDLILLDIDMPEMDGFQVLAEIKKRMGDLRPPVLFLTANTNVETVVKCIEAGGFDVVEKPFIKEILCTRIVHALALSGK